MKTKIFKTVLPAIAIVLAMGLSFAIEANRVSQTGYFDDPDVAGIQQEPTNCAKQPSGVLCLTIDGFQLYNTAALDATPNNELRKNNP